MFRNSLAEAAGVQRGDVITPIAHRPVASPLEVRRAIFQHAAAAVIVTVTRNVERKDLNVEPEAMPDFDVRQR